MYKITRQGTAKVSCQDLKIRVAESMWEVRIFVRRGREVGISTTAFLSVTLDKMKLWDTFLWAVMVFHMLRPMSKWANYHTSPSALDLLGIFWVSPNPQQPEQYSQLSPFTPHPWGQWLWVSDSACQHSSDFLPFFSRVCISIPVKYGSSAMIS